MAIYQTNDYMLRPPLPNEFPGYDTKPSDGEIPV